MNYNGKKSVTIIEQQLLKTAINHFQVLKMFSNRKMFIMTIMTSTIIRTSFLTYEFQFICIPCSLEQHNMVHEDHSPCGGQSQVNMRTNALSQDASSVSSHTNLQSEHLKCNILYSLPSIFTLFTDPGCTAELLTQASRKNWL